MGQILLMKKATLLLTAFLLLTGCYPNSAAAKDDSLYRAINRQNLEWVKETVESTDLDNALGRNGQTTTSALIYAMTADGNLKPSQGPTDIFQTLLEYGADANKKLSDGTTPCFHAVGLSDEAGIQYMELMLEYGADLSIKDSNGNTVLDEAVKGGHDRTAIFLMEKGAIPTESTLKMLFNRYYNTKDGRCSYKLLRTLIADYGLKAPEIPAAIRAAILGENPAAEDVAALSEEDQKWLLCCVAAFGEPETLASLVTMDYDAIVDGEGWSLWEIAAANGNQATLHYLLQISSNEKLVWRALNRATLAHQIDCTVELLDYFDIQYLESFNADWQVEWLWRNAVTHDDPELLMLLYERGPLPSENGTYGSIADAIACGAQNSLSFLLEHFEGEPSYHLDTAGRYNNLEAAQLLVGQGIPQFSLNEALSAAAAYGSKETVQLLLACGADPSYQEPTHGSPLLGAAQHGYLEIVNLLLEYGADPLQIYWDEKDNILIETAFGSNRILHQLIEAGAEINHQNIYGATPLMYAVLNNRPENVRLLLECGADPSIVDSQGDTALSIAEQKGFDEIVSILNAYQ